MRRRRTAGAVCALLMAVALTTCAGGDSAPAGFRSTATGYGEVVGDCLYGSREGQVKETACDGSGEERPEYRVVRAVGRRAQCPPSADLYGELGRTGPVGCARRP
ncbi:hypothetical protein [Streptomyces sp. NPDC000229]|uniref:hypothetical protein n=1 Tax=Streptomyces sp. NPDC000229 TaxID=3154247 RepID=UPI0033346283